MFVGASVLRPEKESLVPGPSQPAPMLNYLSTTCPASRCMEAQRVFSWRFRTHLLLLSIPGKPAHHTRNEGNVGQSHQSQSPTSTPCSNVTGGSLQKEESHIWGTFARFFVIAIGVGRLIGMRVGVGRSHLRAQTDEIGDRSKLRLL